MAVWIKLRSLQQGEQKSYPLTHLTSLSAMIAITAESVGRSEPEANFLYTWTHGMSKHMYLYLQLCDMQCMWFTLIYNIGFNESHELKKD